MVLLSPTLGLVNQIHVRQHYASDDDELDSVLNRINRLSYLKKCGHSTH